MREALLIVRKAKGAPSLKLGAPDALRAEFKQRISAPEAGVTGVELWDSSGGRVRRQKLKQPIETKQT